MLLNADIIHTCVNFWHCSFCCCLNRRKCSSKLCLFGGVFMVSSADGELELELMFSKYDNWFWLMSLSDSVWEMFKVTKYKFQVRNKNINPANVYLFKVNNRNNRKRGEICSKLIIKTPKRRHWRCSDVFLVNLEHTLHLFLEFLLLTLNKKMFAKNVLCCAEYA